MVIRAECGRCAVSALDEIDDDERWLWLLVTEAERVNAGAPPGPDPQRLADVEQRYAAARHIEQRIQTRITASENALARLDSWLRPGYRWALVRHLKADRVAAIAAAEQRGRIEQVRNRLRAIAAARSDYLARHYATLAAGTNAQEELNQLFDDLIDNYARLPEPPAWFRFGLGFPPEPGKQREWLSQARETLAKRRRLLLDQPKW